MIRRFLDNEKEKNKNEDSNKGKVNKENLFKNKKNDKIEINRILKKNQVVILAIALMLMTAGYMNYTNNHENENMLLAELGDAKLVSANVQESSNLITNESEDNNINSNEVANEMINDDNNNSVNNNVNDSINTETSMEENIINNTAENNIINNVINENSSENITENVVETSSNTTNSKETSDYFTKSKLERETMYSQMLESYQNILENEKIPSDQKGIAQNEIKNINDTKNAIMIVENLLATKGFKNVIVFINEPSINVVTEQENLTTEEVAQIQNIVQRELNADIQNIHISSNKG